ncbi:hypothetical protein BDZ91DRAFT_732679 [Kalaharituber pfeilii]|nr:hypothetical protein BDZ91DRAFT_732679 [Kalaharituber pfeilii]
MSLREGRMLPFSLLHLLSLVTSCMDCQVFSACFNFSPLWFLHLRTHALPWPGRCRGCRQKHASPG